MVGESTLSEALQVMACGAPAAIVSPPTGPRSVSVGGVVSRLRVAHRLPFMNRRLSRPDTSPQPLKMLLLPGDAEPSSHGELSDTQNTRPLPYDADAAIALLVPCGCPIIHTHPFPL